MFVSFDKFYQLREGRGKSISPETLETIKQAAIGDEGNDPVNVAGLMKRYGISQGTISRMLRTLTPEQREKRRAILQPLERAQRSSNMKDRWARDPESIRKYMSPEHKKWLAGMWPGDVPANQIPAEFKGRESRWRKYTQSGKWHARLAKATEELQAKLDAGEITPDQLVMMLRTQSNTLPPEQSAAIQQVLKGVA